MKRLTTTDTSTERPAAILSDCEQHRYRLWREWDRSRPALGFIMLNPSTADHQVNDPTITRCLQRALLAGRYGAPGGGEPVPAAVDGSGRPAGPLGAAWPRGHGELLNHGRDRPLLAGNLRMGCAQGGA
ncbi:DUF1643 domain-containing protein [Cupriavidus basilensis]